MVSIPEIFLNLVWVGNGQEFDLLVLKSGILELSQVSHNHLHKHLPFTACGHFRGQIREDRGNCGKFHIAQNPLHPTVAIQRVLDLGFGHFHSHDHVTRVHHLQNMATQESVDVLEFLCPGERATDESLL